MLTEHEEDELFMLLDGEEHIEEIPAFIERVTPRYPAPDHVRPVLALFERSRYEPVRATISMAPRFCKTETCMNGLAWRLSCDPATRSAFLSGAASLAREKSRTIQRRFVESGGVLDPRSSAVDRWSTTSGGGLFCGGVGTHIQGMSINGVALLDDVVSGRESAESKLQRDKAWDWFNGDVLSRLEPGASVIVVGTRWHKDDLIGRLHSKDYQSELYEEINLPAVLDKDGNPADERILGEDGFPIQGKFRDGVRSLWPDVRPLKFLASRRLAGEYNWWALYQGVPQSKGSKIFCDRPSRFDLKAFMRDEMGKGGYRFTIAVDPAATASSRADFSVAAVMASHGWGDEMQTYLLYVLRGQYTIPNLCRNLRALQAQWRVPMAIEAVGAFKAVPDSLRETDPELIFHPVKLDGDKFIRSQGDASAWNAGRVHIPLKEAWAADWIAEHTDFTGVNDRNDDQVDAGAHGFTDLLRRQPVRIINNSYVGPFG